MSVNIYNSVTGDLTTVADSIDSLEKVSALPSVTTDLIGKIYLLTDEQTGYKKGGIYECQAITVTPVGTENPSEEGWYEYVSGEYVLSADATVDSSKTYYTIEWVLISSSGDTNIFNGTLQAWEALSAEEKANYSHVATPEEADITGSYSTTETKTGAIWIDGKPIYRKVYHESGVNVSSKVVESGMTYVDTIVSMGGQIRNKADGNIIPFGYSGGSDESIRFNSNNQSISFQGFTVTEYWVIIEYTKTTDD